MKFPNTLEAYTRRLASTALHKPVLTGPARGQYWRSPVLGGYPSSWKGRRRSRWSKRSIYIRNTLERVYKAVIALYIALGYEDNPNKGRRSRLELSCISKIGRILLSVSKNIPSTLKQLKKCAHEARSAWCEHRPADRRILGHLIPHAAISHLTESQLLQISYLGRALPVPPNPSWDLYRKYFDNLTTPSDRTADPAVLRSISHICEIFTRFKSEPTATLAGSSACAEYDRKNGGYSRAVRDQFTLPFMRGGGQIEADSVRVVSQLTNSAVFQRRVLLQTSIAQHQGKKRTPWGPSGSQIPDPGYLDSDVASEALAIKETGFKYRFVTKSPRQLVYYGHILRSQYYPVLRRFRTTSEGLFKPVEEFDLGPKFDLEKKRLFVFSADLSQATDNLSFEAIDFVCQELGIDPDWIRGHKVRCQLGRQSISGTTQKGCFMGLPMSWTILSICHLAVTRIVLGRNLDRARIRGDDLIALMSRTQIESYTRLMSGLGFDINQKSFLSEDRGIFCEKAYRLEVRDSHYFLVEVKEVFSFRFITKALDQFDPHTGNHFSFCSAGSSIQAIRLRSKYWKRLMHFSFGYLIREAKKFGLDPYLPTNAGGLGFPRRKMSKRPSPLSETVLTYLHNSRKRVNLLYDSAAKTDLDQKIQRFMKRIEDSLEYYPEGGCGAIKLCEPDFGPLIGACANYLIYQGSSVKSLKTSLRSHLRGFRDARNRTIKSAVGIKPLKWTYKSAYDLFDRLKPSLASVQDLLGHDPDLLERMGCPSFFPLYGKYDPASVWEPSERGYVRPDMFGYEHVPRPGSGSATAVVASGVPNYHSVLPNEEIRTPHVGPREVSPFGLGVLLPREGILPDERPFVFQQLEELRELVRRIRVPESGGLGVTLPRLDGLP